MTKPPKPMPDKKTKKIEQKLTKKLKAQLDKDCDCSNELCNQHTPLGCYMTMQFEYQTNKPQRVFVTPRKLAKHCNWLIKPTKKKQDAR